MKWWNWAFPELKFSEEIDSASARLFSTVSGSNGHLGCVEVDQIRIAKPFLSIIQSVVYHTTSQHEHTKTP